MFDILPMSFMADSSGAVTAMREYVTPTMQTLTALAAIASVFFIVWGGFLYMSSRGNPDKLDQAKRVLKNALIGLVIGVPAALLNWAYLRPNRSREVGLMGQAPPDRGHSASFRRP